MKHFSMFTERCVRLSFKQMNITVEYVDFCLYFVFVLVKSGDTKWRLGEAWIVFHNIKFSLVQFFSLKAFHIWGFSESANVAKQTQIKILFGRPALSSNHCPMFYHVFIILSWQKMLLVIFQLQHHTFRTILQYHAWRLFTVSASDTCWLSIGVNCTKYRV